jgi:WD40 repeat protein
VAAGVVLAFTLVLCVGECLHLDVRPHRRPSLTLPGDRDDVECLAFSPDGKLLVSSGRCGRVQAWDAETGLRRWAALTGSGAAHAVAFAPDGRVLAWGGDGQAVELCDPATGQTHMRLGGHQAPVHHLAFSPDGARLASASGNIDPGPAEVKVWDLATGREIAHVARGVSVDALAYSPDGKRLAVLLNNWGAFAEDRDVLVLDGTTLAELATVSTAYPLACVAFSADGQSLAVGGSAEGRQPGVIGLWDTATWRRRAELTGHGFRVKGLAFTPDGQGLASVSEADKSVWLRDVAGGRRSLLLKGLWYPQGCLAISPEGSRLAAGDHDGKICLWDLTGRGDR